LLQNEEKTFATTDNLSCNDYDDHRATKKKKKSKHKKLQRHNSTLDPIEEDKEADHDHLDFEK
jgi:hypothetical protein